jgi:L-asparaginase/Glu-tRNA(Gln) amidotransferase subunit D
MTFPKPMAKEFDSLLVLGECTSIDPTPGVKKGLTNQNYKGGRRKMQPRTVTPGETNKLGELVIFFTGGTLAMVYSAEAGGPVPTVDLKEILEPIRGRFEGIRLRPVQLDNRPSSMFTPEEMFQWAQTIKRTLHEPSVKGAIVLHGTDTMEESAFLAQIVTGGFKPESLQDQCGVMMILVMMGLKI